MNEPGDRTNREEALARVQELRAALKKSPRPVRSTTGPDELLDAEALQIRYEMELSAHRETTQQLLAEKDRTIRLLEQQLSELREQLGSQER